MPPYSHSNGIIEGFFDLEYIGLSYTPLCYLSDSVFLSIYIVFLPLVTFYR